MSTKVSIVIPVYGVEKTVGICLDSLFGQDYDNIEYIIVNDCTPDDSMRIVRETIEKYPNRRSQVFIYEFEQNIGVAEVRRFGFDHITGEYFTQVDSDDFCDSDMISSMLRAAETDKADVVIADYYLEYTKGPLVYKVLDNTNFKEPIDYLSLLLRGDIQGFFWNKLVRTEVAKGLVLYNPEIIMWEDLLANIKIFSRAKVFTYLEKPFYHYYQLNIAAATKTTKEIYLKSIQLFLDDLKSFLESYNLYDRYYADFMTTKVLGKLYWFTHSRNNYELRKKYMDLYDELNCRFYENNQISQMHKLAFRMYEYGHNSIADMILRLIDFARYLRNRILR